MLDSLFPPQGSDLLRNSGLEPPQAADPADVCRPPQLSLFLEEHHSSAPANGISLLWRARRTSPLLRRPPPRSPSAAAPCAAPQRPAGARRRKAGGRGGRGCGGGAPAKARRAAARVRERRAGARLCPTARRGASRFGARTQIIFLLGSSRLRGHQTFFLLLHRTNGSNGSRGVK